MTEEIKIPEDKSIREVLAEMPEKPSVISLVGTWVWLTFTEKPGDVTRKTLKELGFRWSPKKEKWYLGELSHGKGRFKHKPLEYQQITARYGEECVNLTEGVGQ